MPASPDQLFAALEALGIAHHTISHPALFTVEQARAHRVEGEGGHTKNLFLRDKKGALFLVTALEETEIALKSLHRTLGATGRFSFGTPELMMETLGVSPGSVTPFAVLNDVDRRVTVVLDRALMQHALIHAHPLTNTMTTTVSCNDLICFLLSTGIRRESRRWPPPTVEPHCI